MTKRARIRHVLDCDKLKASRNKAGFRTWASVNRALGAGRLYMMYIRRYGATSEQIYALCGLFNCKPEDIC